MRFNRILRIGLLDVIIACLPTVANAAAHAVPGTEAARPDSPSARRDRGDHWQADPIFPGRRRASVAVASGVPFVGLGEVAYAPTEQFAVGAIAGVTPYVFGAGVRPRVGLPTGSRTRVALVAPLLYYPTGETLLGDGPPWFLAQPAARFEWRAWDAGYLHAGAGIVAALGVPAPDERGRTVVTYGSRRFQGEGLPWGVWNTVTVGAAVSVFDGTVAFADGMLIMRGAGVPSEWIGGPPVAFAFGIARVL